MGSGFKLADRRKSCGSGAEDCRPLYDTTKSFFTVSEAIKYSKNTFHKLLNFSLRNYESVMRRQVDLNKELRKGPVRPKNANVKSSVFSGIMGATAQALHSIT